MSLPKAFVALDLGSATSSAALVGHVGARWRLIAQASVPATFDADRLVDDLVRRVARVDPGILRQLGIDAGSGPSLFRVEARTSPARRIAVLAGSRRQRQRLEESAARAGWLVSGGSAEESDPVALARIALSGDVGALLLGADRSPAGDERRHLPDLAALAAAVRRLRPELTLVLAGGAAAHEAMFEWVGNERDVTGGSGSNMAASAAGGAAGAVTAATAASADFEQEPAIAAWLPALVAPDSESGQPAGSALQQVLEGLLVLPEDSRIGIARSAGSLGHVLGRSVEVIEIGARAGLRARTQTTGIASFGPLPAHSCTAEASYAPEKLTDDVLDSVADWSTEMVDRHRLADRLRELELVPWGDADGEGAACRLAAAKGAISRLVKASAELDAYGAPELMIAAGGILSSTPPAAVALALADVVRRPGVTHLVYDQARLLGPLGVMIDEVERRRLLANMADDILLPLGSLVIPSGIKAGRSAGRLRLTSGTAETAIDLHPGTVQVIDLPPGHSARVEADFRDNVQLGSRGRHFELDVQGGLCGVIVDLRDVPMRIQDRPESRRAILQALQHGVWPELDQ